MDQNAKKETSITTAQITAEALDLDSREGITARLADVLQFIDVLSFIEGSDAEAARESLVCVEMSETARLQATKAKAQADEADRFRRDNPDPVNCTADRAPPFCDWKEAGGGKKTGGGRSCACPHL